MTETPPTRRALILSGYPGSNSSFTLDTAKVFAVLCDPELGCCNQDRSEHHATDERTALENRLRSFLIGWNPRDQLILYYTGHACFHNQHYCLKCAESEQDFLPFSSVLTELSLKRVEHAIIIIDACYSGYAQQASIPPGIAFITSSGTEASEQVPDGSSSVFTKCFCDILQQGLGPAENGEQYITISNLVSRINKVLESTPHLQRARFSMSAADEKIWIARNRNWQKEADNHSPRTRQPVINEEELELLYKMTIPSHQPCLGASIESLEPESVHSFASSHGTTQNAGETWEAFLSRLHLLSPIPHHGRRSPHKAAVLCFIDTPSLYYPCAKSVFTFGSIIAGTYIQESVLGSLPVQIKKLTSLVHERLGTRVVFDGDAKRKEVSEISVDLIRELIANAIIHRDYNLDSHVQVNVTRTSIDIKSPGKFPPDTSWKMFLETQFPLACPVDAAISEYMMRILNYEGIGRGFSLIREYISEHGRESISCHELPGPFTIISVNRPQFEQAHDVFVHTIHSNRGFDVQIGPPVSDFVGRGDEINTLVTLLRAAEQGGAVISGVRGMGGIGKTELAKVVAGKVKDLFPDGQIMLDLRGASGDGLTKPATPAEALAHVIRSLHPEARLPEHVAQLQAIYHSVLDGKRVLLLMDNALDAHQLRPLIPPPTGCAVLVTSRHRFVLPGMHELDLDTLAPEEASKLLTEICPRIGTQADALAKLCGYLPLALRLGASALCACPDLAVDVLFRDLGDEKKRLAALEEYRGLTDVALGVEASLGISYRMLDESQQRRWRALAVCVGDFDAAAAAAVWETEEGEAKKTLQRLRAASMLEWKAEESRYWLHNLARDYAVARRSDAEAIEDALRHATHYEAVLRAADELFLAGNDGVLHGLALFDREWPNIRAGQAWAASNWEADDATARLCCAYSDAGAYCLDLRLHPRERIAWLEMAVTAARKLQWREMEGRHLGNLGIAYADLGETRKAIECHELHRDIAREIGDRRGEGNALGSLGLAYADLGEMRKAIEYHEQALVISREIGDRRGEGCDLGNLGIAYADLGETRKAIEYHEQALVISREIGDRRGEGCDLGSLGLAYATLGETRKAIECYEWALIIFREIGDRRGEGNALANLGNAYANLGEARKTIECHEQELGIARETGDRRGEGNALYNIADGLVKVGRRDEAVACAERAVEIYAQIESPTLAKARARLERLRGGG